MRFDSSMWITSWLRVDKRLVVHTAALYSRNLSGCSTNYGYYTRFRAWEKKRSYPEFLFYWREYPRQWCADLRFCQVDIQDVQFASGQQRLMIHMAAIMVSNFTNHLTCWRKIFVKQSLILVCCCHYPRDSWEMNSFRQRKYNGSGSSRDTQTIQSILIVGDLPVHQSFTV